MGFASRVRGIYATALAKILLDGGFEIAQPSIDVAERLHLRSSPMRFELDIRDRQDRQGVESSGSPDAQESFRTLLRGRLDDVIVRMREMTIPGRPILDAELPSDSKRRLDQIRSAVAPTVSRHHYLKACGGGVSAAVDMAERLLSRGRSLKDVEQMLQATIELEFPLEDSPIRIERVSLDGEVASSTGTILSLEGGRLEVRMNGAPLELPRRLKIEEASDHTVVRTEADKWMVNLSFYSESQSVQAWLVCFATPPELYPYGCQSPSGGEPSPMPSVRWVDLGVELASKWGGQIEITGMDRLEEYGRRGLVTEALVRIAREKLSEALSSLRGTTPSRETNL